VGVGGERLRRSVLMERSVIPECPEDQDIERRNDDCHRDGERHQEPPGLATGVFLLLEEVHGAKEPNSRHCKTA
jgi:hypothetical protein